MNTTSIVCESVAVTLNRFLTCQYIQLHDYIWNKPGGSNGNKQRQWDRVVERVKHQLILRAMSCMQIASKLVDTSKVSCIRKYTSCVQQLLGLISPAGFKSYFFEK
jgi:hypothetical protein